MTDEFGELFAETVFAAKDAPNEVRKRAGRMRYAVWQSRDAAGPPVILLQDVDGLGTACRSLAVHLQQQGFRVHLPTFFGGLPPDSKLGGKLHSVADMGKVRVRREFACIATKRTSPVSQWVRALATHIDNTDHAERGIGVIGVCLTGGIALATLGEDAVKAAVAAQPSLPWSPENWWWPVNRAVRQYSLAMGDDELYEAIEADTSVLTVRLARDPIYQSSGAI